MSNPPETVLLHSDPTLGLYAGVDSRRTGRLQKRLNKHEVHFAIEPEGAARLAEPGRTTFVFGGTHPVAIREELHRCGLPVELGDDVVLSETTYRPPVEQLLRLGAPDGLDDDELDDELDDEHDNERDDEHDNERDDEHDKKRDTELDNEPDNEHDKKLDNELDNEPDNEHDKKLDNELDNEPDNEHDKNLDNEHDNELDNEHDHEHDDGERAIGLDCALLGLGPEQVPELIRMATDEQLLTAPTDTLSWAPVLAWRALGELQAATAVGPLLGLLDRWADDDDAVAEEVPWVLTRIGPATLAPLADFLADPAHHEMPRLLVIETLGRLGQVYPETQAECIARLAGQLERAAMQSPAINGFLVASLLDLKATAAAPAMAMAFAANVVDELVAGDWEDVQIELGLKQRREHPPHPNRFTAVRDRVLPAWAAAEPPWAGAPPATPDPDAAAPFAEAPPPLVPWTAPPHVGRNDPCPCGSGKKHKKCCGVPRA